MPRLAAAAAFAVALTLPAYAAGAGAPIIAAAPSGVTTDAAPTFSFSATTLAGDGKGEARLCDL